MIEARRRGFTMVEIMVVLAIIGILAMIAIPKLLAYRQRSYRAQLFTDVHTAVTAQEAYFTQHDTYGSDCTTLPGFTKSALTTLTCAGDTTSFSVTATNAGAPSFACTWTSTSNPPLSCS